MRAEELEVPSRLALLGCSFVALCGGPLMHKVEQAVADEAYAAAPPVGGGIDTAEDLPRGRRTEAGGDGTAPVPCGEVRGPEAQGDSSGFELLALLREELEVGELAELIAALGRCLHMNEMV